MPTTKFVASSSGAGAIVITNAVPLGAPFRGSSTFTNLPLTATSRVFGGGSPGGSLTSKETTPALSCRGALPGLSALARCCASSSLSRSSTYPPRESSKEGPPRGCHRVAVRQRRDARRADHPVFFVPSILDRTYPTPSRSSASSAKRATPIGARTSEEVEEEEEDEDEEEESEEEPLPRRSTRSLPAGSPSTVMSKKTEVVAARAEEHGRAPKERASDRARAVAAEEKTVEGEEDEEVEFGHHRIVGQ